MMKIRILCFYLGLIFVFGMLSSFKLEKLKGKIIDSSTNQPVYLASIQFTQENGKKYGVVSNADGEFSIYFSKESNSNPVLEISVVGYKKKTVILDRQKEYGNIFEVKLEPDVVQLSEFTVYPYTGEEIMKNCIGNLSNTLPNDFYSQKSYIRTYVKTNGKEYSKFLEAQGYVISKGFNKKLEQTHNKYFAKAIRSTLSKSSYAYSTYNEYAYAYDEWENRFIYHFAKHYDRYIYSIVGSGKVGTNVFYTIEITPKKHSVEYGQFVGTISIFENTWQVKQVDLKTDIRDGYKYKWCADTIDYFQGQYKQTYSGRLHMKMLFKPIMGKSFMEYFYMTYETFLTDSTGKKDKHDIYVEVLNYETYLGKNKAPKEYYKLSDKNKGLDEQKRAYNADDWIDYIKIEETEFEKKLRKDLEEKQSMEQQFETKDKW